MIRDFSDNITLEMMHLKKKKDKHQIKHMIDELEQGLQ